MMGLLYDVEPNTITYHLQKAFKDHELIHKYDVVVAKNYLSEKELSNMGRLVNAYLDLAELQAERNRLSTVS